MVQLLAHQGGWDEALLVVVPMLVFAVMLRAANRRAARRLDEDATHGDVDPDTAAPAETADASGDAE